MTDQNVTTSYGLTPVQEQVIAATAASIHRNTCLYWRRTSAVFRDALSHAQYDKAVFIREESERQVAEAFAAIHTILTNPDASDIARLSAAKLVIEKASTPPPPQPEVSYRFQSAKPEIVHSFAQSRPPAPPSTPPRTVRDSP